MNSISKTLFVVFTTFLILTVFFAFERVIILDNALHIFHVVNENHIGVMAGRWPTSIVRLPLWIGIQLNMPLTSLIYIYSISHLILLSIFVTILYRTNEIKWTWAFILLYLAVVQHTFFWCVSELIPSLVFVFAINYFFKKRLSIKTVALLFLFNTLALFMHPQSILALLFIGLYHLISNPKLYLRPILLISTSSVIYVLKGLFFKNWYDTMKMEGLKSNIEKFGFQIQDIPSFSLIMDWMVTSYAHISLLTVTTCLILLLNKKVLQALGLISSVLTTIVLFTYSNPNQAAQFYFEATLYLITFFSIFILFYEFYPKIAKCRNWLLPILKIFAIAKIVYASSYYSARIDYIKEICLQTTPQKLLISEHQINKEKLGLTWGLPFETLLVSTLENDKSKTIIAKKSYHNYDDNQYNEREFYNGMGGKFIIKDLSKYFELSSTTPYSTDENINFK